MIYMSYFNHPKVRTLDYKDKVSVSRRQPRYTNPKLMEIEQLMPDFIMINKVRRGEINWDDFADYYIKDVLINIDPHYLAKELDGKVLLCHCGGDSCHRFIIAEWFKIYGYDVSEL